MDRKGKDRFKESFFYLVFSFFPLLVLNLEVIKEEQKEEKEETMSIFVLVFVLFIYSHMKLNP